MPNTWRKSISFASSTSLNYSDIHHEKVLSKSLFGEVFRGRLNENAVVVRVLNHKRSQIREFCKEALVLRYAPLLMMMMMMIDEQRLFAQPPYTWRSLAGDCVVN
jgi:predicted Ser/Thr protein kinase